MGITIHYEAHVRFRDSYLIPKVLEFVQEEAKQAGYEVSIDARDGYVEEMNVYNETGKVSHKWFSFSKDKTGNAKPSTIREVIVSNKINGEYMSESFRCGFFFNAFTKRYEWRDFTKTQIFSEKEAEPNIRFHIWIIKTLCMIKLRYIENLKIDDEGDYFFTEKGRKERMDYFKDNLKKYPSYQEYIDKWEKLKPFDIKVLLESHSQNLSIISDVMNALQGVDTKDDDVNQSVSA
jgi:hypothetical protein